MSAMDITLHGIVRALAAPPRSLWQPETDEQIAAIETLLGSDIPAELRTVLHRRHEELTASA